MRQLAWTLRKEYHEVEKQNVLDYQRLTEPTVVFNETSCYPVLEGWGGHWSSTVKNNLEKMEEV